MQNKIEEIRMEYTYSDGSVVTIDQEIKFNDHALIDRTAVICDMANALLDMVSRDKSLQLAIINPYKNGSTLAYGVHN